MLSHSKIIPFRLIIFLLITLLFTPKVYSQDEDEFSEFKTIENQENGGEDEFMEFEQSNDEFEQSNDEFSNENSDVVKEKVSYTRLYWSLVILAFTILAGFMVRYRATRKLRAIFLIASVVILGFYRGGCPGPISSFMNTYLMAIGVEINWQAIIWFLGLIPITYILGQVFCGWICHLGALQEFLFIPKISIWKSTKAQKILKIVRTVVLIGFLIQLTFTHVLLWNKVGPFKVAFNLFSANLAGYILLGILLLSSVFIYRPFCKAICPVGLLLGWISKIPGASILGINNSCIGCKNCNDACNTDAITRENKTSYLDNTNCILCGDCLDSCKSKSISFHRKGKTNNEKIILKSIKKYNNK